jgi:hypothetical protein
MLGGLLITLTVTTALVVQFKGLVAVKVYCVVTVGETTIVAAVLPLLHE